MHEDLIQRLAGPIAPIMPAFRDDESLDLDATAGWVDGLIEAGIAAFWTTYGTSHYLSLTDREIEDLTAAVAAVTRGRSVFIASTQFHWPTHACLAFAERAAREGVDAIKVQLDWRLRPTEASVLERYGTLAERSPLPLLAYALGGGTFGAGAGGPGIGLFRQLLAVPHIVGMKNDVDDFYGQSEFQAAVRDAGRAVAVITGGSMESFLHGRRFGQRTYAVGLAMIAPDVVLRFDRALAAGDDTEATRIVRDVEQPWTRAVGPLGHWAALHEALRLQAHFPSRTVRFPLRTLDAEQARTVEQTLARLGLISTGRTFMSTGGAS